MVSMVNRLCTEYRGHIIGCLTEGMSIRATVRVTGAAKNTIVKLLVDLGEACAEYQDGELTNLKTTRVECDEIWSFCYAKQKNVPEEHRNTFGYGDIWTWTAIDADTKLVPSWLVGERTVYDAYVFMADLRSRLDGRIQLSTDGLRSYLTAVDGVFADDIDYGIFKKLYGNETGTTHSDTKYSPGNCTGIQKEVLAGNPDQSKISTSYVKRQNLTMRMGMSRYARLTNEFSKKVENLTHAVSLHYMHYNFARPHSTLAKTYGQGRRTTPAMAAGKADRIWSLTDIAGLLD